MAGKQMEGDNVERRKRAREAKQEGQDPGAEGVTLGGSKQRSHTPRSDDRDERLEHRSRGKRD